MKSTSKSAPSQAFGLPPLRSDAPGRLEPARAALPALASESDRASAVRGLLDDVYAASSLKKQTTLWNTVQSALDKFYLVPFPFTREKLLSLGAALKAGRYSTAVQYLNHYKGRGEREGYTLDPALLRVYTDVVRSCKRGVGGPIKALALPLLRLGELNIEDDLPWLSNGPVGSASAMIAGSWFLAREVELSTTRARLVSLETGVDGEKAIRWYLPASKNDPEARGVSRAHGCACVPGITLQSCPYCAVEAQLHRLKRLFPDRWQGDVPDLDLPLFPTSTGTVVVKQAMSDTIVEAASRLGVPLASPDKSARVSGHSLRVTGAQGLSRAGVEVWAIQLLGRWGSSAVLGYVREVPLELSTSWAAQVRRRHALDAVLKDRSLALPPSVPISDARSAAVPPRGGGSLPVAPVLSPAARSSLEDALDEADDAARVDALPYTECRFVTSEVGRWHRLGPSGLAGPAASWSSACGWKFGGHLASLSAVLPDNLSYKDLCMRCLPERRQLLKG